MDRRSVEPACSIGDAPGLAQHTAIAEAVQATTELFNGWRMQMRIGSSKRSKLRALAAGLLLSAAPFLPSTAQAQQQRPNVVMLMTDDTGWSDFGVYGGGANLGHPTPNIDRIGQEGAVFTSWYGQASCTAGRASFMTGRIPIRSALSVVVVPGDENGLTKSTPTIAEFFQKNGYGTYYSGKWHLGDQPKFYPIEHGFDEMKEFAAYYPGVYTYDDTDNFAHPWFPKFNAAYWDEYQKIVNLYRMGRYGGQARDQGCPHRLRLSA